jgi:hypothetical protein
MATVLIEYKGNVDGLEASLKEIEKANEQVSDSAKQSAKEVSEEYRKLAQSSKAAFASEETKKSLASQTAAVDKLKDELELLFKEEVRLLKLNKQSTEQYKQNRAEAERVRKEFDKLNGTQTKLSQIVIKTSQDVSKFEDELRKLSLEGKQGTKEFDEIAKAIGTYKAAITTADRAVDLYAKSTDAATGRLGELEDKLYDLALAGDRNTQEFKDTIAEVTKLKRAVFEVDQQVDSYVERSRGITSVVQSVELLGNAFQIVEGASAAFGVENEDLQETLVRLNAIMAVTNGLEQVRTILLEQSAKKTGVFAVAQSAYNVVVGSSVGLMKAFRIALAATGLGALVFLLYEIYRAFEDYNNALKSNSSLLEDSSKATLALKKNTQSLREEILTTNEDLLVSEGKLSDAEKERNELKRNAVKEGLKANGDAIIQINKLIAKEKELKKEIADQTEILGIRQKEFDVLPSLQNKSLLDNAKKTLQNSVNDLNDIERQRLDLVAEVGNNLLARKQILSNQLKVIDIKDTKESKKIQEEFTQEISNEFLKRATIILKIDRDLAKEREEIEKDLAKFRSGFLLNIDETTNQELLNQRVRFLQRLEAEGEGGLQNRLAIIQTEGDAEIAGIEERLGFTKDAQNQIKIIEAETQERIRQERKRTNIESAELTIAYVAALGQAFNAIADLAKDSAERQIEQIERIAEVERIAIENSSSSEAQKQREREALEKRTTRTIIEERRKIARLEKATGIFDAVVNTAVAITNALKQDPPLSFILAAAAGITGATQIAKISSEPLPSFGKGGWIDGEKHSRGGVNINAEGGEFITSATNASGHKRELEAMNTSRAAFLKVIEERYVRPRLMEYALNKNSTGMNVNVDARLNSASMENELRGLRKDTRNTNRVIAKAFTQSTSSRYNWN